MAPRPTYTGGRTVYDGAHAVTGQRATFTGQDTVAPAPAAKKGGGLLGAIKNVGHVVAQKSELAARDIKGIPGGVIQQVETGVVHPWADFLTTGHVSKRHNAEIDHLINQVSDSTAEQINHPGRDPLATLLFALPLLHGAGRVAGGSVEAARTLKAGEGVRAAAKAATGSPAAKPRTLNVGDAKVPLIPSGHAVGRVVQSGYDKVLQRALDKNPEGRVAAHAQRRVGGALKEEARIQQKMRAVPASMLDRAAGKLSKLPAARRQEQAALELTSVNTTAEDAARYHFNQAANGVNAKQNLHVGRLYQRVARRGLLTKDQHGNVIVDAAKHPRLAATDAALARVQKGGDQILVEKDVRSAEALQARVDAPGRVRAGATYEKPTPGKAGKSSALVAAIGRRNQLAALHSRALDQEAAWYDAQTSSTLGRNGDQAAEAAGQGGSEAAREGAAAPARLLAGQVAHWPTGSDLRALSHEVVENHQGFRDKNLIDAAIGAARNRHGYEGGDVFDAAANLGHSVERQQALVDGNKRLGYASMIHLLKAHGYDTAPLGRDAGAAKMLRRVATKKSTAADLARFMRDRLVPAASNPYRNRIVRLGHALEDAQTKVDRIQAAAERRVKPAGIVGGETARPGRGFVSARVSEKKLSKAEASASRGPVVGEAKTPFDSKTFTGRSIEQGLVPKHVTASASRHYRQILRFVNTDATRRRALETGSDVRRSSRDVLVRVPDVTPEKFSADVQQALGRETSTVDTAEQLATQEGLQAAHQAFLDSLIPDLKSRFANDRSQTVGVKAPEGYRWVDRGALGDLARQPEGPRGRIARSIDTVNSAVTAMTVYFKVGHVGTRVLTNAATNIIQGSAAPLQAKQSFQLWEKLGPEERARALAAAGQHGFSALPHEGTNLVAAVAGKGAQWWAKHADATFRFNSLAHELRKAGYGTQERFRQALDHLESGGQGMSGAEWAKLSAAARRADREAISYDRLNDFERRYITRAIWFYPWIKGSTLFTVRTAIEHPYKAGYLGVAGVEGRQAQEQQLGPTPSYEAGLVRLFGGGNSPGVADFSTFSPFATAADVIEAPGQPGALAGFLNPAAGAAGQFAYGLNRFGGPSKSPYLDALLALGSATPEQQIAEAYAAQGQDQSGRMFPKTPLSVLERYLVGPALPRRVNRSALAQAAAREKSGRR